MRLPDVVKTEYETLDETEWDTILKNIKIALNEIDEFRIQEGNALLNDISSNVQSIQTLLAELEPFEEQLSLIHI